MVNSALVAVVIMLGVVGVVLIAVNVFVTGPAIDENNKERVARESRMIEYCMTDKQFYVSNALECIRLGVELPNE